MERHAAHQRNSPGWTQVAECREAAEGLQALLAQGIFVDAGAAPAEAIAELQQLMDHISELKVMGHRCLRDLFMLV